MDEIKILSTVEEIKAISDPFKFKILTSFLKHAEPSTVKQIADSIKEVPSKVHYHVKKMESLGILKLVYTKEIKGIVAKFYEPTAKKFDIKCSDEYMAQNKRIMLSESQHAVERVYEESKECFFKQMEDMDKDKNNKNTGAVILSELWLTQEEADKLLEYITEFDKSHEYKNQKEDEVHKKFHMFMTMIRMDN